MNRTDLEGRNPMLNFFLNSFNGERSRGIDKSRQIDRLQNNCRVKKNCSSFYISFYIIILLSTMDNERDELHSLSFEKLFQLAQERFNEYLYDDAEIYYEAAYRKKPHDQMIVLCYAHLLKLNQKEDQAQEILIHSLQQNPNGTYKRYFQLAELYDEEKSIQLFQEGIKVAEKCLQNPFLTTSPMEEVKRDIAQATGSIAAIYINDMTIDFKVLEGRCWAILKKGKEIDPTCMDVRLQIANFYYEVDKEKEAIEELMVFKNNIMSQKEEYDDQIVIQCAKQFLDLNQPKEGLQVLEKVRETQGDNPQILYYMAGCNFELQKYRECKELLEMYPVKGTDDEEINRGVKILRNKLNSKLTKDIDETEEGMEDDGDDEWVDIEDDFDE